MQLKWIKMTAQQKKKKWKFCQTGRKNYKKSKKDQKLKYILNSWEEHPRKIQIWRHKTTMGSVDSVSNESARFSYLNNCTNAPKIRKDSWMNDKIKNYLNPEISLQNSTSSNKQTNTDSSNDVENSYCTDKKINLFVVWKSPVISR